MAVAAPITIAPPADLHGGVTPFALGRRMAPGREVDVQVWLAQSPFAMVLGYHEGFAYGLAWAGKVEPRITLLGTLEYVFARFQNVDDCRHKPKDYDARSLSVGDVITLDLVESWAVGDRGWQRVPLHAA